MKNLKDRLRDLHDMYDADPPSRDADGELEEFRQMKDLLDARPKHRPDAAIVDVVLAAARGNVPLDQPARKVNPTVSQDEKPRTDRAPVARQRSTILRIGTVSAILTLFLAVVGIFQLQMNSDPAPSSDRPHTSSAEQEGGAEIASTDRRQANQDRSDTAANAESRTSSPPRIGSALNTPPEGREAVSKGVDLQARAASRNESGREIDGMEDDPYVAAFAPASDASVQVFSWEHRDDVMEVFQQIERIDGGVDMDWEPPVVPLEMLPGVDSESQPYLQQAGERRD